MNLTPIGLEIVRYPIIIEYPNAAHIPFQLLFTDTNLLSEIFNHVSLYTYGWHVRLKSQVKDVVTVGDSLFLSSN